MSGIILLKYPMLKQMTDYLYGNVCGILKYEMLHDIIT